MNVSILKEDQYEMYDAFLKKHHKALLYHSIKYKEFLQDLLKCDSNYLVAMEDDEIKGVIPIMIKTGKYGKVANSLPYYGSNGGIIADDIETELLLIKKYNALLEELSIAVGVYITNPFPALGSQSVDYELQDKRIGQITRLPGKSDDDTELLKMVDSTAKRNIRKAIKSNVSVEVDNYAVSFLEETHKENMLTIGGNAKAPEFFDLLSRHFHEDQDYRIYIAKLDKKPIAALLVLYFNKTVEYFMPVTKHDYRNLQPMALILYRAMVDAIDTGFQYWNWGGTWHSQEGVYRFKKKWGAEDHPYNYYINVRDKNILQQCAAELLASYPGFYTVPFDALKKTA